MHILYTLTLIFHILNIWYVLYILTNFPDVIHWVIFPEMKKKKERLRRYDKKKRNKPIGWKCWKCLKDHMDPTYWSNTWIARWEIKSTVVTRRLPDVY